MTPEVVDFAFRVARCALALVFLGGVITGLAALLMLCERHDPPRPLGDE